MIDCLDSNRRRKTFRAFLASRALHAALVKEIDHAT